MTATQKVKSRRGRKSAAAELATKDDYIDFTAARAKEKLHQANIQELKEAELRGELVSRTAVDTEQFNTARAVRDGFLNLPGRVSAALVGMDQQEIARYLRQEILTTLETVREELTQDDENARKL